MARDWDLYDLVSEVSDAWGMFKHSADEIQRAETITRLDTAFNRMNIMDLTWDIAEQKLFDNNRATAAETEPQYVWIADEPASYDDGNFYGVHANPEAAMKAIEKDSWVDNSRDWEWSEDEDGDWSDSVMSFRVTRHEVGT